MTTNILGLTPLKEEYNSEEEEDQPQPESRKISPFNGRRLSIEGSLPNNELNINLDNSNENNNKQSFKSPKKNRKTAKIISQRIIMNKNTSSKVDLCLFALAHQPNKRNQEMIYNIKSYLKTLPSFMNIISKEQNVNISDNLIEQISIHLRHEFIPKNNLVCRYGERGEKFYIILKGKVTFFVPKMIKCYLNLEEYINYLIQLRNNDEFEIINNLLVQNRSYYPIEDDNIDEYLINEYEEYQRYMRKTSRKKNKSKTGKHIFNSNFNLKSTNTERKSIINNINNNKNNDYDLNTKLKLNRVEERFDKKRITLGKIPSLNKLRNNYNKNNESKKNFFSYQTYKKIGLLLDKIHQHKNNNNLNLTNENIIENIIGENSPKTYLKSNNVINRDLDSKGRKLINVYNYEEMNTFENGQTFGFIALVSKTNKRASTAIVTEDCDLGVLTKDEYLQFFELLSMKEKKNLYELLRFYNLIISISEHKFIKKYYHMFEFKKYYKNHFILDTHKHINELLIFSQGLFIIFINVNIPELNDLITKIKIIKGKLLGLSKYKIEKTLEEKRENQDLLIRKKYMSEKESKILLKKYNYTLSIISDHLILGNVDTVDPETHLPLFNCICNSAECDGYSITNKSIKIINEENIIFHKLTEFCLMKMEYNLTRLKQFKKEILSKIKENEISELKENQVKNNNDNINNINNNINGENITEIKNNTNYDTNEHINKNNLFNIKINYINRNELDAFKNVNNNSKKLLSNKINKDKIEQTKNLMLKTKNEEMKNLLEKGVKKSFNNTRNKITIITPFNSELNQKENSTIKKLKESIINKQKKIEIKIEENNKNINSITNHIKYSLSSESFDKYGKSQNKTRNNKTLKKTSISTFKNFLIDFDKINLVNNQMLTPLLTKNKLNILPNIKNKNKKLKNFFKENELKLENENNKINSMKKKYEKIITDDLYKIDQFSFIKEKFIVFKSNKRPFQETFNTVNYDNLPKIDRNKQNHPFKLKKQFFNRLANDDNKNNNDNKIKEIDDKKSNYINSSVSKMSIKQNMLEKNINDKYNELNNLVNNIQNITKEKKKKKA